MVRDVVRLLWEDPVDLSARAFTPLDTHGHREFTKLVRHSIVTLDEVRLAQRAMMLPGLTARLCTPTQSSRSKQRRLIVTLEGVNNKPVVHYQEADAVAEQQSTAVQEDGGPSKSSKRIDDPDQLDVSSFMADLLAGLHGSESDPDEEQQPKTEKAVAPPASAKTKVRIVLPDEHKERPKAPKRPREHRTPEQEVVDILAIKSHDRTPENNKRLFTLLRSVKAFAKVADVLLRELCSVVTVAQVDRNRIVFRQGDHGTCWYVILNGAVDVLANNTGQPAEWTRRSWVKQEGLSIATIEALELRQESWFLVRLEKGQGFGELALVNDAKRAASIVTAEPTTLLRVEKRDYNRILRFVHDMEQKEKILLVRKTSVLQDLEELEVKIVADVIQMRTVPEGTVLLETGHPIAEVGIVSSGKCEAYSVVTIMDSRHGPIKRHVHLGFLGPGDYFGEQGVQPSDEDKLVLSTLSFRVVEEANIGFVSLADARVRIQKALRMMPWTQLSLDKDGVVWRYCELLEKQKWNAHKLSVVDGLWRERLANPNVTRTGYLHARAHPLAPFRFK
nr:hypothetical protein HK105_005107 [Polyrhizophydium stewartii]